MARLITSGAEFGVNGTTSILDGVAYTAGTGSAPVRDTGVFRSGAASFRYATAASGDTSENYWTTATTVGTPVYMRWYQMFESVPIDATLGPGLGGIYNSAFDTDVIIAVYEGCPYMEYWNGSSYQNNSIIGSQFQKNQWSRIELMAFQQASGLFTCMFWQDGVLIDTETLNNGLGAYPTSVFAVGITNGSSAGAQTYWVDDVAINDNTGTAQNYLPGPGSVVLLKPTSDNARTGFTNGTGGTTNLFAAVNSIPPAGTAEASGIATSQIRDNTSNTTDSYQPNMTTYAAAGITGQSQVNVVYPFCLYGNSTTTSRTVGLSVVSNPIITEGTSTTGTTAASTYPTGWNYIQGSTIYNPTINSLVAPVMKFRKGTASTDYIMACFMGIYVEYGPVANPGSPNRQPIGV